MRACGLIHFSHVQLFATPWTLAHQAPLSMRFSRQGYRSGLPCPSPGDLPDPGIKPKSLMFLHWQAGSLPLAHLRSPVWERNYRKVGFVVMMHSNGNAKWPTGIMRMKFTWKFAARVKVLEVTPLGLHINNEFYKDMEREREREREKMVRAVFLHFNCLRILLKYWGGGWDKLGDWDWHIYTTTYKMDN